MLAPTYEENPGPAQNRIFGQEVKLLIRDVVMALAYCHDHGVAHRTMTSQLLEVFHV